MFFDEILKATNDFALTKKVINSINFKNMETNKKSVNLDELVKALTDIGVEVDPTILKGENTEKTKEQIETEAKAEETAKTKEADDLKKAQDAEALKKGEDKDADDKDKDKKDDEIEKNTLLKKSDDKDADDKNKEPKDKSEKKKKKKEMKELEKSLKNEIGSMSGEINKGITGVVSLFKSFAESIDGRLTAIENQTPGRKSMPTTKAIEKSFGGEADDKIKNGKTELSISRDKQKISDTLLAKSGILKGEANKLYCDGVQEFEAAGYLSKAVITDLYTNENILITQ
jgi:hypothetical protein